MEPCKANGLDRRDTRICGNQALSGMGRKKATAIAQTRRVDLLYEDFVVVLRLDLRKGGDLKANFVTCYQANNSGGRIRAAPLWRAADCINALRQKKGR